jgi:hypothetical protein
MLDQPLTSVKKTPCVCVENAKSGSVNGSSTWLILASEALCEATNMLLRGLVAVLLALHCLYIVASVELELQPKHEPSAPPAAQADTAMQATQKPAPQAPTLPPSLADNAAATAAPVAPAAAAVPPTVATAAKVAAAHLASMKKRLPADLMLKNGLKSIGSVTDQQLEPFFRKCITPGAKIVVGALGGSISRQKESYIWELTKLVKAMCSQAHVEGRNGSRVSESIIAQACRLCTLLPHNIAAKHVCLLPR